MSFSNKQIKTFKPIIAILLLVVFLVIPIYTVQAQLLSEILNKIGLVNTEARLPTGGINSLPALIGTIIKAALLFVGTIFLVVTLYGGFTWMTAGGNADQVKKAASLIRNGVIGLIIIFVSFALTLFVFDVLLKASITPTS